MKIICFGDSNTFGYDPRSYFGERYPTESRWVDILAAKTGWEIRNNGMNGREIPLRETVFSRSTDLLIIMLGTNDLLQGNNVHTIAARMDNFLSLLSVDRKKILLIAPPPLQRGEWVQEHALIDTSAELGRAYSDLANRTGILFADAGEWDIPIAYDGVHFTEEGHRLFAQELRKAILSLIHFTDTPNI